MSICPVCKDEEILSEYEILPNICNKCGWILDDTVDEDDFSDVNYMSIKEYRENFKKYKKAKVLSLGYKTVSDVEPSFSVIDKVHDIGNWGLVSDQWKILIPPKYMYPLAGGYDRYIVATAEGFKEEEVEVPLPIDKPKKIKVNMPQNIKYGVVDSKDNVIIPIEYSSIIHVYNVNSKRVEKGTKTEDKYMFECKREENSKPTILDRDNNVILPPIYDEINDMAEGYVTVIKYEDNIKKVAVYDTTTQKEIIPLTDKYENMQILSKTEFIAELENNKCDILDQNNNIMRKSTITTELDKLYKTKPISNEELMKMVEQFSATTDDEGTYDNPFGEDDDWMLE